MLGTTYAETWPAFQFHTLATLGESRTRITAKASLPRRKSYHHPEWIATKWIHQRIYSYASMLLNLQYWVRQWCRITSLWRQGVPLGIDRYTRAAARAIADTEVPLVPSANRSFWISIARVQLATPRFLWLMWIAVLPVRYDVIKKSLTIVHVLEKKVENHWGWTVVGRDLLFFISCTIWNSYLFVQCAQHVQRKIQ